MHRRKNTTGTDKNEENAKRGGSPVPMAEETEQRVCEEDDPCCRGKDDEDQEVICVAVRYRDPIEHRADD